MNGPPTNAARIGKNVGERIGGSPFTAFKDQKWNIKDKEQPVPNFPKEGMYPT